MTRDIPYLLERSLAEAVRAIQSLHPAAAAAHHELCRLYMVRALAALTPPT